MAAHALLRTVTLRFEKLEVPTPVQFMKVEFMAVHAPGQGVLPAGHVQPPARPLVMQQPPMVTSDTQRPPAPVHAGHTPPVTRHEPRSTKDCV